jgi:hypothetical protein
MAWYPGDDHNPADAVDEGSVGLIAPKSESATRRSTKQRQPWTSKSFLGILLIVSNVAWAGFCLMLWQTLYIPPNPALARHDGFETDFGTSTYKFLRKICKR